MNTNPLGCTDCDMVAMLASSYFDSIVTFCRSNRSQVSLSPPQLTSTHAGSSGSQTTSLTLHIPSTTFLHFFILERGTKAKHPCKICQNLQGLLYFQPNLMLTDHINQPIARQIYLFLCFLRLKTLVFTLYTVSTVTRSFCFYNSFISFNKRLDFKSIYFIYFNSRNFSRTVT